MKEQEEIIKRLEQTKNRLLQSNSYVDAALVDMHLTLPFTELTMENVLRAGEERCIHLLFSNAAK